MVTLIAETLLEYETLTKEQIEYLAKNGCMPEEEIESENLVDKNKEKKASAKIIKEEEDKENKDNK